MKLWINSRTGDECRHDAIVATTEYDVALAYVFVSR